MQKENLSLSVSILAILLVSFMAFIFINSTPFESLAQSLSSTPLSNPESYHFVREWGSIGTGDGQFDNPNGIATDSSGNVYVTDLYNDRIQKFDSNGNFITKWNINYANRGIGGIAIDSSGNVYITNSANNNIQKFDSNGNFITEWGSIGYEDGQFAGATDVALDSSGNVYVIDAGGKGRIQKFDSNGNFITKWNTTPKEGDIGLGGIDVDIHGYVYVFQISPSNNNIQKFDSNGNFITEWGSQGTGDGQFSEQSSIATDSSGNVYVADSGNNRIQKFDSNGNFITKWNSNDTHGEQPAFYSIAVGQFNNIYITDWNKDRILVFAPITDQSQTNGGANNGNIIPTIQSNATVSHSEIDNENNSKSNTAGKNTILPSGIISGGNAKNMTFMDKPAYNGNTTSNSTISKDNAKKTNSDSNATTVPPPIPPGITDQA